MWYYLVRYSFDPEKTAFGPFNSEEEAWTAALTAARKEFDIDKNENGWDHCVSGDESTEYLVFEI